MKDNFLSICLTLALLALLLPACRSASVTDDQPPDDEPTPAFPIPTLPPDLPVVFPRQQLVDDEWVRMTSKIIGTLIEESGCLRIVSDFESESFLVVWPPHYSLDADSAPFQILDHSRDDQIVARLGQEVHMGGGETRSFHHASVPDDLEQQIPRDCPGPYWISGGVISP